MYCLNFWLQLISRVTVFYQWRNSAHACHRLLSELSKRFSAWLFWQSGTLRNEKKMDDTMVESNDTPEHANQNTNFPVWLKKLKHFVRFKCTLSFSGERRKSSSSTSLYQDTVIELFSLQFCEVLEPDELPVDCIHKWPNCVQGS